VILLLQGKEADPKRKTTKEIAKARRKIKETKHKKLLWH
jgi:hypothetical protein